MSKASDPGRQSTPYVWNRLMSRASGSARNAWVSADPLALDVTQFHTFGVDWRPGSLAFDIDGEVVHRLEQAPDYPVQLMVGVFDFPAKGSDPAPIAEMVVSHARGEPLD